MHYVQNEHGFTHQQVTLVFLFSLQEVEPMSRESDNIHIIALSDATGVCIRIEHLDRSGTDATINHHDFPDDGREPMIYLLYKPGHYDILYKHVN